jgi:hypothetical protein
MLILTYIMFSAYVTISINSFKELSLIHVAQYLFFEVSRTPVGR